MSHLNSQHPIIYDRSSPSGANVAKLKFRHSLALSLGGRSAEVCADFLRANLPVYSHAYIDAALRGDKEAAGKLLITDNDLRPLVLLCLFATCRDSAGFKEALKGIWAHDGPLVLQAISSTLLCEMFECGRVRPPDQKGPIVIYRGGQGDVDAIRRSWSWTTHRGVAAWFANRFPERDQPVVVEARVRPSRIPTCNEREEHEVVIAHGVRRTILSGTPDDWATEAMEWHMSLPTALETV